MVVNGGGVDPQSFGDNRGWGRAEVFDLLPVDVAFGSTMMGVDTAFPALDADSGVANAQAFADGAVGLFTKGKCIPVDADRLA